MRFLETGNGRRQTAVQINLIGEKIPCRLGAVALLATVYKKTSIQLT